MASRYRPARRCAGLQHRSEHLGQYRGIRDLVQRLRRNGQRQRAANPVHSWAELGTNWRRLYAFDAGAETGRERRVGRRRPCGECRSACREAPAAANPPGLALKTGDATAVSAPPADPLHPSDTERAILNAGAVKRFAPVLLGRYNTDEAFRRVGDRSLQKVNEDSARAYYRALATVHKDTILAFQAELERLAASGRIDKLVPLEEQYQRHPERRPLVQAAWDRVRRRAGGGPTSRRTSSVCSRKRTRLPSSGFARPRPPLSSPDRSPAWQLAGAVTDGRPAHPARRHLRATSSLMRRQKRR